MAQSITFFRLRYLTLAMMSGVLLTACNSDNKSTTSTTSSSTTSGVASVATGNLLSNSTNSKNLTAEELKTAAQQIDPVALALAGDPVCGVRVEYMHYDTVDVKGNPTDATGAVLIPTGSDPKCTGERPVVLHAHGTATMQNYNFAEVGNANNEAGLRSTTMATTFVGQGYVVIAPNYAGYDKSTLEYHPYLNANQQSKEMADALKAGRNVLKNVKSDTNVSDNGKLFLTGYSQGGHAIMAAARYFEQLKEPVTAMMPMSGPYAMAAFGDVVFSGNVMVGATFFSPLMARNYQIQYGDIYTTPSDIFAPANADEIETLLPSKTLTDAQIIAQGKLPYTALFQKAPTGNLGLDSMSPANSKFDFGFNNSHYLLTNKFRLAYLQDMQANPDWFIPYAQGNTAVVPMPAGAPENGLRKALKENDLRGYLPNIPVVLCGGNQDPMVFFDVNTSLINGLWIGLKRLNTNMKFGVIDVDATNASSRTDRQTYQSNGLPTVIDNTLRADAQLKQQAFATNLQALQTSTFTTAILEGKTTEEAKQLATQTVMAKYHGLVAPHCMASARTFFNQF